MLLTVKCRMIGPLLMVLFIHHFVIAALKRREAICELIDDYCSAFSCNTAQARNRSGLGQPGLLKIEH